MSDLTQTREILAPPEGTIIAPADFVNITGDIDNVVGLILGALGGPNFFPAGTPLKLVPGNGMQVVAGGTGQRLIAQGRLLDVCPATPLPITAAGTTDRVDLIAVQATRGPGALTQTRTVIPDNAPSNQLALKLALVGGVQTYVFNPPFSAPPVIAIGAESADAGAGISFAVSATQIVVSSTDANDARTIDLEISGVVPGSAGAPQSIALLESSPAYLVVTGTSTLTPPTPAGYEALASIFIHANEATIAPGDITLLFPQLPALSEYLTLSALTILQALSVNGSAVIGAGLRVLGTSTISGNETVGGTLNVTGGGSFGNGLGVSGESILADLIAASTILNVLQVKGTATIGTVTGQPVFLGDGLSGYGQLGLKDSVQTGNAPRKFIRANGSNGAFEVISADASRVVLSVDDAGNTSAQGNGTFAQLFAFATNGVRRAIRTNAANAAMEFINSAYSLVIATLSDNGDWTITGAINAVNGAITGNTYLTQLLIGAKAGVSRGLRLNTSRAIEFVNSAYTAVIATLGDDGSLSLSGPLSAPSVAADLTGNFTSSDGTVAVTDAGGRTNFAVPQRYRPYGGSGLTDANGNLSIQAPFAVSGASGNLSVQANANNFYIITISQASNFATGLVVFRALGLPSSGQAGVPLTGAGVIYTITPT